MTVIFVTTETTPLFNRILASGVFALLIAATACVSVSGQSRGIQIGNLPQAPLAVSLDSAVEMAITADPRVRQINWQIEEARGNGIQQSRFPNPVIGVVANEIGNDGDGGQYGAYISRKMIRNNRLHQNRQIFRWQEAKLRAAREVRHLEIARRASEQFFRLARTRQEIGLENRYLAALQRILQNAKALERAGEISKVVVANVELAVESQRQFVSTKNQELETGKRVLAVLLGLDRQRDIVIEFQWEAQAKSLIKPQKDDLLKSVLAEHPELERAYADIEQGKWRVQRAQSERCPDYQLQVSANYDAATDDFFAGFQVGVPLQINDRKRGMIQAAKAQLQQAHEGRALVQRLLSQKVVAEVGRQNVLRNQIQRIEKNLLTLANETEEKVMVAFRAGEASFLQVKSSLDSAQQIRRRLLQGRFELFQSQLRLETVLSK